MSNLMYEGFNVLQQQQERIMLEQMNNTIIHQIAQQEDVTVSELSESESSTRRRRTFESLYKTPERYDISSVHGEEEYQSPEEMPQVPEYSTTTLATRARHVYKYFDEAVQNYRMRQEFETMEEDKAR